MLFVLRVMFDCRRISFLSSQFYFMNRPKRVSVRYSKAWYTLFDEYCQMPWVARARESNLSYVQDSLCWAVHGKCIWYWWLFVMFWTKLGFGHTTGFKPVRFTYCTHCTRRVCKWCSASLWTNGNKTTIWCFAAKQSLQVGALQPASFVLKDRFDCVVS